MMMIMIVIINDFGWFVECSSNCKRFFILSYASIFGCTQHRSRSRAGVAFLLSVSVSGLGFRVSGLGFRVEGLGLRV